MVVNSSRGLPYVGVLIIVLMLFWTFITDRTRFGRHVYAVGGNAEAARRAGIGVDGVRIAVFAISSSMAALGGIVLASRLSSVDTNAGGGSILLYSIAAPVIGGTSLFGGRGTIRSAILGAIVIASIDNGLGLHERVRGHEVHRHRPGAARRGDRRLAVAQGPGRLGTRLTERRQPATKGSSVNSVDARATA